MKRADYFQNTGGLNTSDSPFTVDDKQATGGFNFEYLKTGAIKKRLGYSAINDSADADLRSKGWGLYNPSDSDTKTVLRAGNTKIQELNVSTGVLTDVVEDTTAVNSTFFSSTSSLPVHSVSFNSSTLYSTWFCNGGANGIFGYAKSGGVGKITNIGVSAPTGTATYVAGGSGGTLGTGNYFYALGLRKALTQSESNAALDNTVAVAVTLGQKVTVTFPVGIDTTKYDKWVVYRSAVGGVTEFTTGSIVAYVDTTQATYVDDGTNYATSQNIPRAGSVVLDNSPLDLTKSYVGVHVYKGCLVTFTESEVIFSDLNKPESFPTDKKIVIPSGGKITGGAVLSFSTNIQQTEEVLIVFKKNECWVISGEATYDSNLGLYDLFLNYLDATGSINQNLIVNCGGFIAWIDYRGIFMWTGSGKPIYVSKSIENLFSSDGDLDFTKLDKGFGFFARQNNHVNWVIPHKIKGENKVGLRLDLKLTVPQITTNLNQVNNDSVITADTYPDVITSGIAFLDDTTQNERILIGTDSGYLFELYKSYSDDGTGIDFSYETKWLTPGNQDGDNIDTAKRFFKVVAYCDESGDWDLALDYYADFNPYTTQYSTISESLGPTEPSQAAIWDLAIWDEALWDSYEVKIKPVIFNLNAENNANEGSSIKLKFRQNGANEPVVIHGFSIFYDELGTRR